VKLLRKLIKKIYDYKNNLSYKRRLRVYDNYENAKNNYEAVKSNDTREAYELACEAWFGSNEAKDESIGRCRDIIQGYHSESKRIYENAMRR
jgi:hypothetical protein